MKPRSDWFPIERNLRDPERSLAHLAEEEPAVGSALGHERDASGLLGDVPEVGGVEAAGDVDDAHAVGADDAHPARPGDGLDLLLHGLAGSPRLAEPRGEDDAHPAAARAERAHGGQDRLRGEAHQREIEPAREVLDPRDGGATENGLAARVDGNDVARESPGRGGSEPGGVRASRDCAMRPARPRRAVRRAASGPRSPADTARQASGSRAAREPTGRHRPKAVGAGRSGQLPRRKHSPVSSLRSSISSTRPSASRRRRASALPSRGSTRDTNFTPSSRRS